MHPDSAPGHVRADGFAMPLPRSVLPLLLALALLPGCISTPAGLLPLGGMRPAAELSRVESEIVALVNLERAAHGRAPLAADPALAELARAHSREMALGARPFGHDRFRDRAAGARALHANAGAVSENVAARLAHPPHAAPAVVRDWIDSEKHRDAILDGSHRRTGVGVWRASNGEFYFTQIFVAERGARIAAR
jgi:uncharacterized protein YkwD